MPNLFVYLALSLLLVLPTFISADQKCTCGYNVLINTTRTSSTNTTQLTNMTFTSLLETDFLHLHSIFPNNPCWSPQVYTVDAAQSRGPYGKNATLANVVPNPLKNDNAWTGEAIDGGGTQDAGLKMWVNATGGPPGALVSMAEMATARDDLFYGSFRVGARLTSVPGTCAGFFWYHNDSAEIDIELLSSNLNASSTLAYLIMQSPQSAAAENALGTPFYDVAQLPATAESLTSQFHEYRFDWTPVGVSFYLDGIWLHDMSHAYPLSNGSLFLNHWSNGNQYWSQGPPLQNAVLTVEYVRAYFNSSDPATQDAFDKDCRPGGEACGVGNGTTWFARGMCGESGTSYSQNIAARDMSPLISPVAVALFLVALWMAGVGR